MSERVSDFRFGHRKGLFWSEEKQWKWLLLTLKTGTSGGRNYNPRPVLISALWRGNVVSNLLTFGHWKVVFSLFLILYRAFSHFMYLTFCQFRKKKMVQSWFQKQFWNQDCDVVRNLVVEIAIYNFDLFHCALLSMLTASPLPLSKWEPTFASHLTVCGLVVVERHVLVDQARLPFSAILA